MWLMLGLVALLVSWAVGVKMRTSAHWRADQGFWNKTPYLSALTAQKQRVNWRLGLAAPGRPEFQLKAQGDLDDFFHRLGVSDEVQTADSRFDRLFYVASDHPVLRERLQQSSALRQALCKLRESVEKLGWTFVQIRLGGGRLWVEARGSSTLAQPQLALTLPHLLDALAQLPPLPAGRQRDPYLFRAGLILALSTALAIGGGLSLYGLLDRDAPRAFDLAPSRYTSGWLGPLLAIGLALVAVRWLKRSARTHFVLVELLTVGMFGCWALTLTGLRHWNMASDRSPAVQVETKVVASYTTKSWGKRRRTIYWLTFEGIPARGIPTFDVEVSDDEFRRGQACYAFSLRQGALGWAWFEGRREVALNDRKHPCGSRG